jgi:hypothetical protein
VRYPKRFTIIAPVALCVLIAIFVGTIWTKYFVIPANIKIAEDTMTKIEATYKSQGNIDSVARAEVENCWGQPIKIIVVKVGSPSNAHEVTVVSPGPLGIIGVASVNRIIEVK